MAGEPTDKTYTQAEVDALLQQEVAGLKANRDELAKEAKRAKEALKNYEGVDPEEHRKLKEAAAEAERRKATAEGDFKSLEKQLVERHTAELAGRDGKIGKLQAALERRLVEAQLTKAIAEKKGVPDLLLPYARQFVRVKETEDDFEAYIADEKGNPLYADGRMTPMDFGAFVEQHLMAKFPRAFDGTGSSGGGASRSNAGGGGVGVIADTNSPDFLRNLADIASGKAQVAG